MERKAGQRSEVFREGLQSLDGGAEMAGCGVYG